MTVSWRPSAYKTDGDMEQWCTSLRALGIKLAVVSTCSFSCKALLVALSFFHTVYEGSALFLSLSTLLVEALPTTLTIILLTRYHSSNLGAARGSSLGTTLLTKENNIERVIVHSMPE